MKKSKEKVDIKSIEGEYKADTTIWNEDNPTMTRIKEVLFDESKVSLYERTIFLYYSELCNYAEVARQFNSTPHTIKYYVNKVRAKLKRSIETD